MARVHVSGYPASGKRALYEKLRTDLPGINVVDIDDLVGKLPSRDFSDGDWVSLYTNELTAYENWNRDRGLIVYIGIMDAYDQPMHHRDMFTHRYYIKTDPCKLAYETYRRLVSMGSDAACSHLVHHQEVESSDDIIIHSSLAEDVHRMGGYQMHSAREIFHAIKDLYDDDFTKR